MVLDKERLDHNGFYLDGQQIEELSSFVYLGSTINTEGSCMQEVIRRLATARNIVQKMTTIWKSRNISKVLKLRVIRSTAFAVATHGCESWTLTKRIQNKVNAFEMWAYRRLLRISWQERKSNTWVLDELQTNLMLLNQIIARKLNYFGHAIRHQGLEKLIIQGMLEGKRGRGRPPRSWCDDITDWTGKNLAEASHMAEDRKRWRATMKATAARARAT